MYCTFQALQLYLGMSQDDDDLLLGSFLLSAQRMIDVYTHRTFEAASDTTRYFDTEADVCGPTLYLDEDLAQITTVTNGDGSVVSASSYVTEPRNYAPYHAIRLKANSGLFWEYDSNSDHENAISIVGRWAYSVTVPDDIELACKRLAGFLYRQKDAAVYETTATPELGIITVPQAFPRDVKNILEPYRKLVD